MIPLDLRLTSRLFALALRLHSSTPTSPLNARFRLVRPCLPATHASPLHLALHRLPVLPPTRRVEKIDYAPVAPWEKAPYARIVVADSKEASIVEHDAEFARLADAGGLAAYSDGSLIDGRAGAAAAVTLAAKERGAWWEKGRGMGQHQSVYAAELEGARLALHSVVNMIKDEVSTTATVFLDNQAAARSPFDPAPSAGQTTRLALRDLARELEAKHPDTQLTIQWVAGHKDVAGNEVVDEMAKRATKKSDDAIETEASTAAGRERKARRGGVAARFRGDLSEQESVPSNKSDWEEDEERKARDFERRFGRNFSDNFATLPTTRFQRSRSIQEAHGPVRWSLRVR